MHRIFSNFAYILLLGMSGMVLLMGKIRPFSMELLPFLPLKKPVYLAERSLLGVETRFIFKNNFVISNALNNISIILS